MSTQPVTPIPAPAVITVPTQISILSAYLKAHELLIGFVILVALVWGVSGKITGAIADHDQKVLAAQQAISQAQADKNAALAKQNADTAAQFQVFAQQAQAANQQLEETNAKLALALKSQQTVDASLPPADLATRIETLAKLPPNSVVPAPGDLFSVTAPAAVSIAQGLESVPVLTTQLSNAQTEKTTLSAELDKQGTLVSGLNQQVSGLQIEIVDDQKTCKAQVALEKANARKAGRWKFVAGYISGLVTRGAIKLLAGV